MLDNAVHISQHNKRKNAPRHNDAPSCAHMKDKLEGAVEMHFGDPYAAINAFGVQIPEIPRAEMARTMRNAGRKRKRYEFEIIEQI